jgi:hypothetical protein
MDRTHVFDPSYLSFLSPRVGLATKIARAMSLVDVLLNSSFYLQMK